MKNKRVKKQVFSQCNLFPKNSKGQFYLIFAIIVMGLVTGLLALQNYTLRDDYSDVQKIKEELQIESQQVLDYIYINNENYENTLENFTKEFSNYAKNYEIIYITGKNSNPQVYKYEDGEKSIFVKDKNYSINGNDLTIKFNNVDFVFELKEGENFYFIVAKKEGGEVHVETNAE